MIFFLIPINILENNPNIEVKNPNHEEGIKQLQFKMTELSFCKHLWKKNPKNSLFPQFSAN